MKPLEILHKLKEQKMLSKSHLDFHGIPIEGAFFNFFAKCEKLGFTESIIPRSGNTMFMSNPSMDNEMAIMASIGEPSMRIYELRETFPVNSSDAINLKEEKVIEFKNIYQTVDVPGEESEILLVLQEGKYTGLIKFEVWESDDTEWYVAVCYIDAQTMLEHEKSDFE